MSWNPLLLVGAVIGVITALLIAAYVGVKDKKTSMGFERNMDDGEILRRLAGYARPYLGRFVLVGCLMLFSIARALLKNAPILILDDSVSAVDTRTEKIILDNLKTSRAGKTTLLIAHRISTVERLDKIIFLEDGAIEAVGPHDALYASCEEYRRMVDLQRLEDETGGDAQ